MPKLLTAQLVGHYLVVKKERGLFDPLTVFLTTLKFIHVIQNKQPKKKTYSKSTPISMKFLYKLY